MTITTKSSIREKPRFALSFKFLVFKENIYFVIEKKHLTDDATLTDPSEKKMSG